MLSAEGYGMDEDALWDEFSRTGAPEDYLRYCRARREKEERAAVPVTA
jgi:hypothetical protein